MTDLTPVDLSHLSDQEFNALCPQGEHAPGSEPLSPAAQAVLDSVKEICPAPADEIAAAALRAAANQIAPVENELIDDCWYEKENPVRDQLLAIATELENAQ